MSNTHIPYIVIRDSREQEEHGWKWRKSKYCAGTEIERLETGDYTIKGFENILSIERKGRISEWARNINEKRFERELGRLDEIKHSFILLEFDMSDVMRYPIGAGVPRNKSKIRGPYILRRTMEMMIQHNVKIIFCGKNGKEIATSLFKRVANEER